jgi:hypothetical protein
MCDPTKVKVCKHHVQACLYTMHSTGVLARQRRLCARSTRKHRRSTERQKQNTHAQNKPNESRSPRTNYIAQAQSTNDRLLPAPHATSIPPTTIPRPLPLGPLALGDPSSFSRGSSIRSVFPETKTGAWQPRRRRAGTLKSASPCQPERSYLLFPRRARPYCRACAASRLPCRQRSRPAGKKPGVSLC